MNNDTLQLYSTLHPFLDLSVLYRAGMYCSLHGTGGKVESEKEKHLDQDPPAPGMEIGRGILHVPGLPRDTSLHGLVCSSTGMIDLTEKLGWYPETAPLSCKYASPTNRANSVGIICAMHAN